ncbi:MAG: hypothetical protein WC662_04030 [Candidatus Paceibacterota bacterium]|jgi:hypothetical protein
MPPETQQKIDPLQIKIERAKANLPKETLAAIDSVDWKNIILGLKDTKGYSYEQLWDLEIETELMLYGLTDPKNYPKELATRMNLPRVQVDLLINELNESIFKKIRDYLINNGEIKKEEKYNPSQPPLIKGDLEDFDKAGINIIKKIEPKIPENLTESRDSMLAKVENPENINKEKIQSISSQKLSSSFQIPTIKTEYSLTNLSKQATSPDPKLNSTNTQTPKPTIDPYRLTPEE